MQEAAACFLTSVETECLTAVAQTRTAEVVAGAVVRLLTQLRSLAPSLAGPAGFFHGYGRVYMDGPHVELAAAECDSPLDLPGLVERQQQLVARAVAELPRQGLTIILANNNHDGLLGAGAATWGSHENYLVDHPPESFTDRILPFLATRVYAGAGGVHYPSGEFHAGVRLNFIEQDAGGGTRDQRALHSTARTEHLMGKTPGRYRYHTVLADSNRAHFSLALKHGATLLALKALDFDPDLLQPLPGSPAPECGRRSVWMRAMQRFNVLARPGQPPQADPLALQIQQLYLDGARRFADAHASLPAWVAVVLEYWEQTLRALAHHDHAWLAQRLDPWIKYGLYTAVLERHGHRWDDLPRHESLFYELALLDQNYHEFCNPDSVFTKLEQAGALRHRVAAPVGPGAEPEPFVPATATRAAARARFLRENGGDPWLRMDWDAVYDLRHARRRPLADPFAATYGPWEAVNCGG